MFRPGHIRKIQVRDFVTYSHAEFYPGPTLNMIIGPNGTGKSTMVAAIILGLGGTPKVVGRGTKISEYVKHGCEEAKIDIFLQEENDNKHIKVSRQFTTKEKNVWLLNNQRVSFNDIIDTIKRYNIQVDNLCQFLPQDKVQDFAKLNKQELLKATQLALCRQDLIDKQESLIENRNLHKQITSNITKIEQKLQQSQDANVRLEGKIHNFKKKKKFTEKIKQIDRKIAWLEVAERQKVADEIKEDKIKATQIYVNHKNAAKPLEEEIERAKKMINDLRRKKADMVKALKDNENLIHNKIETGDKVKRNIDQLKNDMISKIAEIKQRHEEVEQVEEKMEELNNHRCSLLAKCGNDEEVSRKTQEKTATIKKLMNQASKLEERKDELNYLRQNRNAEIRVLQNELARLENVKHQRMEKLKQIDRDAYEAVLWVRNNKHLFKGEVFEPMILEINVLDAKNSVYVENIIPLRDKLAFTCVHKEDMNLLIRSLRNERKLSVNVLHSRSDGDENFEPSIPIEHLKQFGFFTYLHSLFTAPAPIMRYLCKTYRIHNIPIGTEKTNQCFEKVPSQIRVFFSNKFRYSISFSKYSGERSSRQNEIYPDNTFSVSVDVLRLENIRGQIEEIRNNTTDCDNKIQELNSQIDQLNNKSSQIKDEIRHIHNQKQEVTVVENRINSMKKKMEQLSMENSNQESIEKETKIKIQTLVQNLVVIQEEVKKVFTLYIKQIVKSNLITLQIDQACGRVNRLDNDFKETKLLCQEAEIALNRVKEAYANSISQLKAALQKAKTLSNGYSPEDPGFFPFMEAHNKLPDDLNQLHDDREHLISRIECLNAANDGEIREFEERQELIENLQKEIESSTFELNKVVTEMEQLQIDWLTPLKQLVNEISFKFAMAFEKMGCAGEISISPGDTEQDYDQYGLSIKVTYRNGEPLQELNAVVQSGGERAVATAAFMLSLQELTPVPFRCVDEINQGMDATNERRIFEFLVDCTTQNNTSQYFLITPKLVPNLKFTKNMMIHIVHNGPFVTPDRKWSTSKLCNPHRIQIYS